MSLSIIYLPLLQLLNERHYSKPMDPTVCPENPHKSEREKQAALEQRRKSCGKSLEKKNHGLTHHARSMSYIEPVISYLETWGSADTRAALAEFLGEDEQRKRRIQQLTIAMAFSSISRESEIPREAQVDTYNHYHKLNGDLFEHYNNSAHENSDTKSEPSDYIIDDIPEAVRALFTQAFTNEAEFKHIQKSLVAMGDPSNTDISHVIINLAHKLDLARCYRGGKAEKEIECYMHQLSDNTKAYGEAMHGLRHYAIATMDTTGNRIRHLRIPYNTERFAASNSNPATCLDNINSALPYNTHHKRVGASVETPFYYKIERGAYNAEHFRQFSHLRSRINYDDFTTRKRSRWNSSKTRKKFGVRLEESEYVVVDNYRKKPLLEISDKRSKKTSLSYCDPGKGYWSAPTSRITSNTVQVGIKLRPEHVSPSVIYPGNANTRNRTFTDFDTKYEADRYLDLAKQKSHILTKADDLLVHSTTQDTKGKNINNEILGRFCDIDSICIFKDNLESRLIAQVRAKQWHESAVEYANEMGVTAPTTPPNITFYCKTDDSSLPKLGAYDAAQQAADIEAAQSHLDNKIAAYCVSELKKPAPASFMEINEIRGWHYAAAHNDAGILRAFLITSPECLINQDKLHRTPLHYAAANACEQSILILINEHLKKGIEIVGTPLDLLVQNHQHELLTRIFTQVNSDAVEQLINAISPAMREHINIEALRAESYIDAASTWNFHPDFERITTALASFSTERKQAYFEKYDAQINAYVTAQIKLRNIATVNTSMAALFSGTVTDLFNEWHEKLGFSFKVEPPEEPTREELLSEFLLDSDDEDTETERDQRYADSLKTPMLFKQAETIAFIKQLHPQATLALLTNYNKNLYRGILHRSYEEEIRDYFHKTLDTDLLMHLSQITDLPHPDDEYTLDTPLNYILFRTDFTDICLFTAFDWPDCKQWEVEVVENLFGNIMYEDELEESCESLNTRYREHANTLTADEKTTLVSSLRSNLNEIYNEDYVDELINAIEKGLQNKPLEDEATTESKTMPVRPGLFNQATRYEPAPPSTTERTPEEDQTRAHYS
ncbi:MAG: SidE phosphodiesterase domain-containing protein [Coxiellaceae bacterium]|nr:SidE phosphodiesterase domain-containing protein [Coxiellaceae bacterium]